MERKISLLASGKGQKGCSGCAGHGTAPGFLPPSVSHCSPMVATVCRGGGAAAETPASLVSGVATSRRKVLQRIWTLTMLPTSPHKRRFLLQEGEQVGGPSLSFLHSGVHSRRRERGQVWGGQPPWACCAAGCQLSLTSQEPGVAG